LYRTCCGLIHWEPANLSFTPGSIWLSRSKPRYCDVIELSEEYVDNQWESPIHSPATYSGILRHRHQPIAAASGRRNDIPLLIRYFCSKHGADKITFDKDAFETLVRYQWPGNVRELENTVERSLIMRNGEVISDSCNCPTKGILSSSWSAKLWSWPWNETGGTRPPLPDF
jgi:hypothetical protein